MLNLLIFYRKTQTGASSPEVKQQVLSLMRIQLQELNENGALAAPVAGELQKISEDYKDYYDEGEKHFFKTVRDLAIEENIPLPENWKQGVDLSKLYRALTVSLLFEDAKCVAFDPARRDFGLTGTAKEAVQTLIGHDLLDAEQYSFIVHAIHNKTASSLLGKTIGFEKKDLHVSPVEIATYAAEQIGKRGLVKKEHIPLLRDIFRINLEESEEIFRNKFQIKDFLKGLRGAGTTIGLLAMMFSPYIGALMGTGEEKEQAQ
jgi:hypothetical protein